MSDKKEKIVKAFGAVDIAMMKEVFSYARKGIHDNLPELKSIIAYEERLIPLMQNSVVLVVDKTDEKQQ